MTWTGTHGNLGDMDAAILGHGQRRSFVALALTAVCTLIATSTTSAFGGGWAPPRRVFSAPVVPSHEMVADGSGTHIASDRGSSGIWYITNAGGTWTECQVSQGDDRQPTIALDGGMIHIAFARLTDGQRGIYVASGGRSGASGDCEWRVTQRYIGGASHPSLRAKGDTLSLAFRTSDSKLRFSRGSWDADSWSLHEVIDGSCCTSPVALALTDGGAPRVAFGDGTSTARGLKFGVRTASGWRQAKVHGGRIKHVALVLDQMPGLFGQPPSNGPSIAFAVANRGAYHATKPNDSTSGSWDTRFLARAIGPLDLTHESNIRYIVYTRNGDLRFARASGGIWVSGTLSGAGTDGQPQLSGGQLTFTRKGSPSGIYHTD